MCLARYKTRPGLTYHYNHSHKERDSEGYHLPEAEDPEPRSVDSPSAGSDSLEGPPRGMGGFPVYPGTSLAMEEDGRKMERGMRWRQALMLDMLTSPTPPLKTTPPSRFLNSY